METLTSKLKSRGEDLHNSKSMRMENRPQTRGILHEDLGSTLTNFGSQTRNNSRSSSRLRPSRVESRVTLDYGSESSDDELLLSASQGDTEPGTPRKPKASSSKSLGAHSRKNFCKDLREGTLINGEYLKYHDEFKPKDLSKLKFTKNKQKTGGDAEPGPQSQSSTSDVVIVNPQPALQSISSLKIVTVPKPNQFVDSKGKGKAPNRPLPKAPRIRQHNLSRPSSKPLHAFQSHSESIIVRPRNRVPSGSESKSLPGFRQSTVTTIIAAPRPKPKPMYGKASAKPSAPFPGPSRTSHNPSPDPEPSGKFKARNQSQNNECTVAGPSLANFPMPSPLATNDVPKALALAPFPMSPKDLESIDQNSSIGGPSGLWANAALRTSSFENKSDDEGDSFFLDPSVDPSTLCPYCDDPLPSNPSPTLIALLAQIAAHPKSRKNPRPSNPLGLKAPLTVFIVVCQRHGFETSVLPEGVRKGWPTSIDWEGVRRRVERMEDVVRGLVARIIAGEGVVEDSERFGDDTRSRFWENFLEEIRLGGSRAVAGVRGQLAHFEQAQPGYYGEQGSSIIHQTLLNFFPPSTLPSEAIAPLTATEFIQTILVPEVGARLILEDLRNKSDEDSEIVEVNEAGNESPREPEKVTMKDALKVLRESAKYGVALFPEDGGANFAEHAGDISHGGGGNRVGEKIVMERARRRRKELEEEEREEEELRKKQEQKPTPWNGIEKGKPKSEDSSVWIESPEASEEDVERGRKTTNEGSGGKRKRLGRRLRRVLDASETSDTPSTTSRGPSKQRRTQAPSEDDSAKPAEPTRPRPKPRYKQTSDSSNEARPEDYKPASTTKTNRAEVCIERTPPELGVSSQLSARPSIKDVKLTKKSTVSGSAGEADSSSSSRSSKARLPDKVSRRKRKPFVGQHGGKSTSASDNSDASEVAVVNFDASATPKAKPKRVFYRKHNSLKENDEADDPTPRPPRVQPFPLDCSPKASSCKSNFFPLAYANQRKGRDQRNDGTSVNETFGTSNAKKRTRNQEGWLFTMANSPLSSGARSISSDSSIEIFSQPPVKKLVRNTKPSSWLLSDSPEETTNT